MRRYSPIDQVIIQLTSFLDPLAPPIPAAQGAPRSEPRPNPANALAEEPPLTPQAQQQSIGLMRVNHAGEVCAQALYQGQAAITSDPRLKAHLEQAGREEVDHLNWCQERITEMGGRVSRLSRLWHAGALGIGRLAGLCGDKYSLGFLAETERQVSQHLEQHLARLPVDDVKSRAILTQMKQDEEQHAHQAMEQGGQPLPSPIRLLMKISAKIMTTVAFYI